MRYFLLPLALVLAACTPEDEKECHDRISDDLNRSHAFGIASGDLEYAEAATNSGFSALAIYVDDDRDLCDYITAGPYLQRK